MPIHTILVATDFSPSAEAAVEYATQLARRLGGAELHVLHAYAVHVPIAPHSHYVLPSLVLEEIERAARAQLAGVEKGVRQAGVACKVHLSSDYAVAAVLALAESLPADLVVMGTRGRTGLKHLALGSVAERTVRLARCPVLTVKAAGG
jgi:universal stress protein A